MKKNFSVFGAFVLCITFSLCHSVFASPPMGKSGFWEAIADSLGIDQPSGQLMDSSQLAKTQRLLEESRINEMNLQMEIGEIKLAAYSADSIKLANQKSVIDSLRSITPGVPVVVGVDTLFYIFTNRGGLSPRERANQISATINKLGKDLSIIPDSVFMYTEEYTTDIMYREKVILSRSDKDGLWMNMSRDELANQDKQIIVETLKNLKNKNSVMRLLNHLFLFILVILIQYILIRLTNFAYRKLKIKIDSVKDKYLKPVYVRGYEFLGINHQEKIIFFLLNILRYLLIIIQLIISIPILFSIFPQTEDLAMQIFSYILNPVKKIIWSVISYIPNLFVIAIICLIIHYVIRGTDYLTKEIETGRLKLSGFYQDWARPTYSIIRFLLYIFMIVLIYPYLPNSDSKIFQGLSVFVGLIVSFGSSAAIGNLIAGMIITYMRPFRIGDRIKINDIIGNVLEKTPIVTRIRTLKNEIVTMPNSTIINSQTSNLSESARTKGLIIYFDVTCGYATPWRQIHQLLLAAAESTQDVLKDPQPFVLEQSFNDFYVGYQINVYINDADKLEDITSNLRQNIQDKFAEAGVSLLSSHYYVKNEMK
jgi:small-conductance mechanosensitive channel